MSGLIDVALSEIAPMSHASAFDWPQAIREERAICAHVPHPVTHVSLANPVFAKGGGHTSDDCECQHEERAKIQI